jgi:hypothetical protein
VRGQQKGAVAKATEETAKAVAAKVRAEDSAAAQKQASSASIVEKMKVVLRPGTEVSYTTLDATLVPGYSGWQRGTVLTLTNGQQWVVTESGRDYSTPTGKPVRVHIVPGSMGSFFMEIEDGGRPRVKFLEKHQPAPGGAARRPLIRGRAPAPRRARRSPPRFRRCARC